jgi:predicted small integral membrane protein
VAVIDLTWMAWTVPTVLFFLGIFGALALMGLCERLSPGGSPRTGILGFETTRGDRLFLSLLSAAFIHLGWLGLTDLSLWWGSVAALLWAVAIFRFV